MDIVVVNADSGWRFTALVRQHAPDLYRRDQAVAFWEACAGRPPSAAERLWGDWPKQLHGNRHVIVSELEELIHRLERSHDRRLALLFVLPGPSLVDPSLAGAAVDRGILERVMAAAGADARLGVRVLRLGLFRARPDPALVDAAQDLVVRGLLDNAWFLAMHARRQGDDGQFAGLRLLLDALRDPDLDRRWLRPLAVAWLVAPAEEPRNRVLRVRGQLSRLVDELDAPLTSPERNRPDLLDRGPRSRALDELEREVEDMLAEIRTLLAVPQPSAVDAEAGFAWPAAVGGSPRYYVRGFETEVGAAAEAFAATTAEAVRARLRERIDERERSLRGFLRREDGIVRTIERLVASHLGTQGAAERRVRELAGRVAGQRAELIGRIGGMRAGITATSLAPPPAAADGRTGPIRRLGEFDAFLGTVPAAVDAAFHLPRRLPFAALLLAVVGCATLPPAAYHWGYGGAGFLADLRAGESGALAHLAYGAVVVGLSGWCIRRAARRARARHRAAVGEMRDAAAKLVRRANDALDQSLAYARHIYALGWCNMLHARLGALEAELDQAQEFAGAFDVLRVQNPSVEPGELERLRKDFIEPMMAASRRDWIHLLLTHWPEAGAASLRISSGTTNPIATRSSFLAADGELEIRPLSAAAADPG